MRRVTVLFATLLLSLAGVVYAGGNAQDTCEVSFPTWCSSDVCDVCLMWGTGIGVILVPAPEDCGDPDTYRKCIWDFDFPDEMNEGSSEGIDDPQTKGYCVRSDNAEYARTLP